MAACSGSVFPPATAPRPPPPPRTRPSGLKPLAVTFDGGGSSDPDGDALTYSWNFGDGSNGAGKSITHTFANDGKFNVVLTVNDGHGGTRRVRRDRHPGRQPGPRCRRSPRRSPTPSTAAGRRSPSRAPRPIRKTARSPRANSIGPSSSITTRTRIRSARRSPASPAARSSSRKIGEVDPNQWYRIHLTVTDSGGLKSSTFLDIKPRTSTFTLATNVTGLKLSLDSAPRRPRRGRSRASSA